MIATLINISAVLLGVGLVVGAAVIVYFVFTQDELSVAVGGLCASVLLLILGLVCIIGPIQDPVCVDRYGGITSCQWLTDNPGLQR